MGMELPLQLTSYLFLSASLLIIGLYCILSKRNLIKILIGIELMVSSANLNFVVFSSLVNGGVDASARAITIISISIGGSVVAVALSFVVAAYRYYKSLSSKKLRRLRW
ncbi:MAG: NADH-quinone oxidoreductase subunit NuoK [Candidatus Asgardarchaeia archaeon]